MTNLSRLAPVLVLLLAACGSNDNDPGPGGVSVGEAKALDEAAAMLDQQRVKPEDVAPPEASPSSGGALQDRPPS